MNTTHPEKHQDRLGSFSPAIGALALHSLDQPDWLSTVEERCEGNPVEFAYCWEEEFARTLDEHQISWQYKLNNRQLLKQKADNLTESEVAEVLEYIRIMESLVEQGMRPDPLDEVMLQLLSEAVQIPTRRSRRMRHYGDAPKH